MKNKKTIILSLAVIVIGVGLFGWRQLKQRNSRSTLAPTVFYSPSNSKTPTPAPSVKVKKINGQNVRIEDIANLLKSAGEGDSVPFSALTKPATCQASGKIDFFSQSSAIDTAKFSYTGIDNRARQVFWKSLPQENGFGIGPNMIAQYKIPDDNIQVIVTLPPAPQAKHYVFTASMNYGRLVDGGVRVYNVGCSGQVEVNLNY